MANIAQPLASLAIPISDLNYDPANARRHGEKNLDAIKASLAKFGQRKPIVVQREGMIVRAGNGTLAAAKALGWSEIAAVILDDDNSTASQFAIADNRTAELAEWDTETLTSLLDGWDEETREMLGFDAKDVKELLADITPEIVEDEVPEPPADPITKPGDLWLLGDHRVLCGDSTKQEDVERLMAGESYNLLMTDPPYGINAASMTMGAGQSAKPASMRLSNVDQWDSVRPPVLHFISGRSCIWGGNYFANELPVSDDWLCWHKKNDGRSFGEFELAWCNYGKRTRHFSHHWAGEQKQHITQKPVTVISWAIQQSETDGLIADFFMGSGTTLIAAEQLGRTCYGMEISPAYCDVIVKRWETLTGKKAQLAKS